MSDEALVERVAKVIAEHIGHEPVSDAERSTARDTLREVADRVGEVADANPDEIVTWYMVEHWLREQAAEEEA